MKTLPARYNKITTKDVAKDLEHFVKHLKSKVETLSMEIMQIEFYLMRLESDFPGIYDKASDAFDKCPCEYPSCEENGSFFKFGS